jgi:predicted membrane channel-forming protein YqfA (hemolysin III family)
MKRKTAQKIGISLYCSLIILIAATVYSEMENYLLMGIILVCAMLGISMSLLWISEKEDEIKQNEKNKVRGKLS